MLTKFTHKKMALTIEEIGAVLKKKGGNIAETARALKVTRQAVHKRVSEDEGLKAIVTDAREALVDVAESQALRQIKKGNTAMIIFVLKTQGKDRGYIERSEITGKDGEPLVPKGYVGISPDEWPEG